MGANLHFHAVARFYGVASDLGEKGAEMEFKRRRHRLNRKTRLARGRAGWKPVYCKL